MRNPFIHFLLLLLLRRVISKSAKPKDNLSEMPKFTWRIENFSQLGAVKLDSLTFVVNENKWRLSLYPKGSNKDQHLSLYLCVADPSSIPAHLSIPTKFSLSIVNQTDPIKTINKECLHYFNYPLSSKGWQFIELRKFNDKSGGYLVEDKCLIEAVFDVSPSSSDKDSDSSVVIDPVYIEAQSFLESLPKAPSTCEGPLFKGYAKEIIDKLISYRLDDLAAPKNESAMMEFISILTNNISVFSDVQATEIVNLKATFPLIVQEWRDSSHVKGTSEPFRSTFVETKSVLQDLVKTEEGLKTKLEELRTKETKLEAETEVIESKSLMLKEERERVSKQMKILCGLVEEIASNIGAQDYEVDCAKRQRLEQGLKSKWAAMRHLFA